MRHALWPKATERLSYLVILESKQYFLWYILMCGVQHQNLIRHSSDILWYLLMITLVWHGCICWRISPRFLKSLFRSTEWCIHSLTRRSKSSELTMEGSISIILSRHSTTSMESSIRPLAQTHHNRMALRNRRTGYSLRWLGPSWSCPMFLSTIGLKSSPLQHIS